MGCPGTALGSPVLARLSCPPLSPTTMSPLPTCSVFNADLLTHRSINARKTVCDAASETLALHGRIPLGCVSSRSAQTRCITPGGERCPVGTETSNQVRVCAAQLNWSNFAHNEPGTASTPRCPGPRPPRGPAGAYSRSAPRSAGRFGNEILKFVQSFSNLAKTR